jgi:hypothetical protein
MSGMSGMTGAPAKTRIAAPALPAQSVGGASAVTVSIVSASVAGLSSR